MIRFLPGLVLLQVVSVALLFVLLDAGDPYSWLKIAAVLLVLTLIVSFWFDALSRQLTHDIIADEKDQFAREREEIRVGAVAEKEAFAREREKIKVKAEREKQQLLQESHERVVKETRSVNTRANIKVGASLTALAGGGVLLLLTELLTLGLLTLSTAGGALGGYVLRSRQQRLTVAQQPDLIEVNPAQGKRKTAPKARDARNKS